MEDSCNRKCLAESILEQRIRNIHGFYNSIQDPLINQHQHRHQQESSVGRYNNNDSAASHKSFPLKQDQPNSNRQQTINSASSYRETTSDTTNRIITGGNKQQQHQSYRFHVNNPEQKKLQQQQQQHLNRRKIEPRTNNSSSNISDINNSNQQGSAEGRTQELVDKVKKRLSLPTDTSIPESFFLKNYEKKKILFSNLLNDDNDKPLSRLTRRQSLFEIGYGQLSTYFKLHVLGAGTYSTVYKGTSRLTNKLVALKEIHLEQDEGVPFTAIREVSLLKELKHVNIITLHDIIYTKKTLTLVFEFVDRDLSKYMDECDHKIEPTNARLFLFQLLRGLKYCHQKQVLHRDIKPQNILISSSGDLKLADFGLARAKSVPTKTFTDEVVTLWYRPPDVLLGNVEYGTSIDMWGVGCIFFEMVAGYTLFTGTNPKKQIECIFEIIGTPDDHSWPGFKSDLEACNLELPTYSGRDLKTLAPLLNDDGIDLLKNLLRCNPRSRLSAQDSMLHKYFANLPSEIHNLPDFKSIFCLKSLNLIKEIPKGQLHNVSV